MVTQKQKHDLKKFIKELDSYRGRHTELVSVYIPHDYDINKIIYHLNQEQGTAENIKSAATRKNVITALEKMVQHLRLFKKTPEHGLAVFSGNVAKQEGKQDFNVWSIEPPVPLKTRIYRCDKQFVLDLLIDVLEVKDAYGLVVVDGRDANIALLKGKTIIPLVKTHSHVPGKMRAGGQSAPRFSRLREGALKDHLKKVAAYLKDQFLMNKNVKGIIVGGPGPTKYDFVEKGYITTELKNKVIAIKDLSYTGEFGLEELVDKSQDVLAKEDIADEKKILGRFFDMLSKKPGMAAYGEKDCMNKLKAGAVEVMLLSEGLDDKLIEEFEKEAEKVSTEIKIISTETREGVQLKEMGGTAAILRYEF